jgi:hypothetical protein
MKFVQVVGHDSLRAIQTNALVLMLKNGITLVWMDIKRSRLSDAMKNRPYQIYEALFYHKVDHPLLSSSAKNGVNTLSHSIIAHSSSSKKRRFPTPSNR